MKTQKGWRTREVYDWTTVVPVVMSHLPRSVGFRAEGSGLGFLGLWFGIFRVRV